MNLGFNGLGNEPDGDEMGDEQMMQELMEAMQAGDDAEAEGDVAPVPGAEQPGGEMGEQIDPQKLQELLAMLQSQNDGSSNMGGAGGSGGPY